MITPQKQHHSKTISTVSSNPTRFKNNNIITVSRQALGLEMAAEKNGFASPQIDFRTTTTAKLGKIDPALLT